MDDKTWNGFDWHQGSADYNARLRRFRVGPPFVRMLIRAVRNLHTRLSRIERRIGTMEDGR